MSSTAEGLILRNLNCRHQHANDMTIALIDKLGYSNCAVNNQSSESIDTVIKSKYDRHSWAVFFMETHSVTKHSQGLPWPWLSWDLRKLTLYGTKGTEKFAFFYCTSQSSNNAKTSYCKTLHKTILMAFWNRHEMSEPSLAASFIVFCKFSATQPSVSVQSINFRSFLCY